jgi:hypothetical protein
MPEAETGRAVQVLDLLLEYLGEQGERWTRDRYDDGDGRRCLVGALSYLRGKHRIPSESAECFLHEAMKQGLPHRRGGLVYFNDRCYSFSELRAVIVQARAKWHPLAAQGCLAHVIRNNTRGLCQRAFTPQRIEKTMTTVGRIGLRHPTCRPLPLRLLNKHSTSPRGRAAAALNKNTSAESNQGQYSSNRRCHSTSRPEPSRLAP